VRGFQKLIDIKLNCLMVLTTLQKKLEISQSNSMKDFDLNQITEKLNILQQNIKEKLSAEEYEKFQKGEFDDNAIYKKLIAS